ncbi:MAG TPA: hypothetical protein VD997_03925 [Phycisphaerales bacterium]|nr:hypothetical protein [Phycisphaerales bacterium]
MLTRTTLILAALTTTAAAQTARLTDDGRTLVDVDGNKAAYAPGLPRGEAEPESPTSSVVGAWSTFGPAGATAVTVAAHPTTPGVVITGVNLGGGGAIYRTTGTFWSTTTGTGTRAINRLDFASTGRGWAATDNGLFTSTDGGQTWTQVTLPVSGQALVEALAIDPTNPNVIWIGLGQFLGGTSPVVVLRSTTNGASWDNLSPPVTSGYGATTIEVDPANPQRVYAAFTPNFGGANELWITTDGGQNWVERSAGTPLNAPINDVAFSNGKAYVVGGQDFGNQLMGLYTTTDDGQNWSDESQLWPSRAATSVAVDPANPQHILVGTTRGGISRSTNGGVDWTYSAGSTATYQVNSVEFSPTSASTIYLGMGSIAVLRSTNSGAAFSPFSVGISGLELVSFAANPMNPLEIAAAYVGDNDGGIYTTTDGGETWTLSSAPLPRWQRVYFGPDGTLYACHDGPLGRADDGLWKRNANGTWTNLTPASPSTLNSLGRDIAAYPAGGVVLMSGSRNIPFTTPYGQIFAYGLAGAGSWTMEYESTHFDQVNSLAIRNDGTAVAAFMSFYSDEVGGILRSTDNGDNWNPAQVGFPATWHAWDVTLGSGPDFFLVGTPNTGAAGAIFRSPDGENWTQQGNTSHSRSIAADGGADGTLFAMDSFGNSRPQRSTDGGMSFSFYDTGYFPGPAPRDLAYGFTVNGARRLYMASSSGGFAVNIAETSACGTADYNGDGDTGTDQDIEAFFACIGGHCCDTCWHLGSDFNADGDAGTDQDIEAFFRVLGGNPC